MELIKEQFGRFFDEFKVGQLYKHSVTKTISESDNNLFCILTLNHHPVHLDQEYAKRKTHGKILVVGSYVFSLVVGMSVKDISGKAIANLGYEQIEHNRPVFIGDTINAETEILQLKESKTKSDRGILFVETRAYNQTNNKVLTFKRHMLIPKIEK